MSGGAVTEIRGDQIHGWLPERLTGAVVEAVLEGGAVAARTKAEPPAAGKAAFVLGLPGHLAAGRMRFIEVRLASGEVLEGSPVLWDGGLLASGEPAVTVEGVAGLLGPTTVTGWARASDGRPVEIEVLRNGRVAASVVANRTHDGAPAGQACGFTLDVSRLAAIGEAELVVRIVGQTEPLPGGVLRLLPSGGLVEQFRGYLDPAAYALLASLPFEHMAVSAQAIDLRLVRFIRRLHHERVRLERGELSAGTLIILPGVDPHHDGGLAARAWSLQSHPGAGPALVDAGAPAMVEAARQSAYVVFARPDEIAHPSMLAALARQERAADVVVWDRFIADHLSAGSPGWTLRRGALDAPTLRQGAMTDTAFAVRGEQFAQAPPEVLAAVAGGDLHPLVFWLAGRDLVWARRPEALTSALAAPPVVSPGSAALCQSLLAEEGSRAVVVPAPEGSAAPFLLLPERRAAAISLILTGAALATETERSLRSASSQAVSGRLEIILVDRSPIAAAIVDLARSLFGVANVRVVQAAEGEEDRNWADLVSVGVEESTGDALVFFDSGVKLEDDLTLEQLALWSLEPGICAVGCAMRGANGQVAHGLRLSSSHAFAAPFDAETDPAFAGLIRSVPAAPVRLAAVSRAVFDRLGGLDAAGHGDRLAWADLMVRAAGERLVHLHLGHLTASGEARDDSDGAGLAAILRMRLAMQSAAGRGAGSGLLRERVTQRDDDGGEAATQSRLLDEALEAGFRARRAQEAARSNALAMTDELQILLSSGAGHEQLADWAARARAAALGA